MSSTDRSYFDEMYRRSPDPWDFESSWYEARKYALTVASLPQARYRSAFEPGCSVGVLTALLSARCDRVLATDIVTSAVDRTRARCLGSPGVSVERRAVPEEWPEGPFDLVVLSEIAYYFDRATLEGLMGDVLRTTGPGATVVAVHWRGLTDYPLGGEEAHEVLGAAGDLEQVVHHVESAFLLDVWMRPGRDGPPPTTLQGSSARLL